MVASGRSVFIDMTFVIEDTAKSFVKTPLLQVDGRDNTFVFGVVRDALRIRNSLGIDSAILGVGAEVRSAGPEQNITEAVSFLRRLGFPVVDDRARSVLALAYASSEAVSFIATRDRRLLQLCTPELSVLLMDQSRDMELMSPGRVRSQVGVEPGHIPSYLALIGDSKSSGLTKRQATRLIELYGDVAHIYENLPRVKPRPLQQKLKSRRSELLERYSQMKPNAVDARAPKPSGPPIRLDTPENAQLLAAHGFYSLVRQLAPSSSRQVPLYRIDVGRDCSERYRAVTDRDGLTQLQSRVSSSPICAIDTESDSSDPRHAELFGVSFCCAAGEALFVPLHEADLKGLTRQDALIALKTILEQPTRFVGHNIKYDYLLLRRNGIDIQAVHFDTMLATYDCFGDWTFFNLGFLAEKLLGKKITSYKEVVGSDRTFQELPLREIVNHACQDADVTLALHQVLCVELEKRAILDQYRRQTLPLATKLGDLEYEGVAVDTRKLDTIRASLLAGATRLKERVHAGVGRPFDLDSRDELLAALRDRGDLGDHLRPGRITSALLEELAIDRPLVQLIVRYRRARKQLQQVDSIAQSIRGNRIYPVFNQIRSRYGQLSSIKPNLFDVEGVASLKECFAPSMRSYFRDAERAAGNLVRLSHDANLRRDLEAGEKNDRDRESAPVWGSVPDNELLLSVAVGASDVALSRRYLVDRLAVSTRRNDLCRRYPTLFAWLERFRDEAARRGYASVGDQRKYLAGLQSSNVAKRQKAMDLAVRWAIRY